MIAPSAPAWQVYARDLLASADVAALQLDEYGALFKLLNHCWVEGDVSADPARIGRVLRVRTQKAQALLPVLLDLRMMVEDDGSPVLAFVVEGARIRSPYLDRYRAELEAHRASCSRAGKRSAEVRRQKPSNGAVEGSTPVQPAFNTGSGTGTVPTTTPTYLPTGGASAQADEEVGEDLRDGRAPAQEAASPPDYAPDGETEEQFVGRAIRAVNEGMRENPRIEHVVDIPESHGSRQHVHDWLAQGIPRWFVVQQVYRGAKEWPRTGGHKQITTLKYFEHRVPERWAEHQEGTNGGGDGGTGRGARRRGRARRPAAQDPGAPLRGAIAGIEYE